MIDLSDKVMLPSEMKLKIEITQNKMFNMHEGKYSNRRWCIVKGIIAEARQDPENVQNLLVWLDYYKTPFYWYPKSIPKQYCKLLSIF